MVLIKNTAFVVLVFLCFSWLSTARFNPTGAAVIESPDAKASIATSVTKSAKVKTLAAIAEGNLNKPRTKLVSKSGKVVKSASNNVEDKKNARSHLADEVNGGPLAFTADYHRPVHHPPKNNK